MTAGYPSGPPDHHRDRRAAGSRSGLATASLFAGRVAGRGQPGSGPATATVLTEARPPVEQVRSSRQDVFEPAERSTSADGDAQSVGRIGVIKTVDEQLHVPVAGPRPLGVDPQPPIGIIALVRIVFTEFLRIVDCELRPDLAGLQINSATAVARIAFERAGEVLEVDRQWP